MSDIELLIALPERASIFRSDSFLRSLSGCGAYADKLVAKSLSAVSNSCRFRFSLTPLPGINQHTKRTTRAYHSFDSAQILPDLSARCPVGCARATLANS